MSLKKDAAARELLRIWRQIVDLGEVRPTLDVPRKAQSIFKLPQQMEGVDYVSLLTSPKAIRSFGWAGCWLDARNVLRKRHRIAADEALAQRGERLKLEGVKTHEDLDAWAAGNAMTQWLDQSIWDFASTFDLDIPHRISHLVLVRDLICRSAYCELYEGSFPLKCSRQLRATLQALATMSEEGEDELEARLELLGNPKRPGLTAMRDAIASRIASASERMWLRPEGNVTAFVFEETRTARVFLYADDGMSPCTSARTLHQTVDLSSRRLNIECRYCGDAFDMCALRVDAMLTAAEHVRDHPEAYAELEESWEPIDPLEWFERANEAISGGETDRDDHWFGWRLKQNAKYDTLTISPAWVRYKKTGSGFVTKPIKQRDALDLMGDASIGFANLSALSAWVLMEEAPTQIYENRLLIALSKLEHVYFHDKRSIPLQIDLIEPTLELDAQGDSASLMLRAGDELMGLEEAEVLLAELREGDNLLYSLDPAKPLLELVTLSNKNEMLVERWLADGLERIASDALEGIVSKMHTLTDSGAFTLGASLRGEHVDPDDTAQLMLRFNGHAVRARLASRPLGTLGAIQVPGEGLEVVYGLRDTRPVHTTRLLTDEREAARLAAAELALDPELADDWEWQLDDLDAALDLVALAQDLHERGELEVLWDTKPVSIAPNVAFDDLQIEVDIMDRYLKIGGEVDLTDHGGASLETLLALSREGRRWLQLSGGGWARVEDRLTQALSNVARAQTSSGDLSALAAPQLLALEELGAHVDGARRWLELHDRIDEATHLDPSPPDTLDATLRPYQREGFAWLSRLSHWAPGAILADDMGLGKTIQALTLLLTRAHIGPALVVAPTSLGSNWRREAARFAPSLSFTLMRSGAQLQDAPDPVEGDVWVMSYDLAARHAERIESIDWATHTLDEAQAIKNPETQRARTSRSVGAAFTLALSGTPIENRALELWSLTSTVTPGLLGRRADFERQYARVIERGAPEDAARARRALAASVSPFILRRTKREVAADLPDRIDVRVDVELSQPARVLYDELRRAALLHQLDADADAIQLLAALTRLRQIACHPKLFLPDSKAPSSKLEVLRERIGEALADDSKCLVFSQFTSLLDLAQRALEGDGVRCVRLDGSMSSGARERAVASFQAGEADVFLLSIKAGGTGLNLTAATSVFILDPWWNPAVEDQAADRAHRIGQTEPVTVYKLIARGTIEEAIYEMHADKRALAADLLAGSSSSKPLDVRELRRLLSISPEDFEDFPDEAAQAPPPPAPSAAPSRGLDDDALHERIDAGLDALVEQGKLAASSRGVYNKGIHQAAKWARSNDLPLDEQLLDLTERFRGDVASGRWSASNTQAKTIKSSLKWLLEALRHT